jgi:hypothetical protein
MQLTPVHTRCELSHLESVLKSNNIITLSDYSGTRCLFMPAMPEGHQFVSEGQRPGIGDPHRPLRPVRATFMVFTDQIMPIQGVVIFLNILFQGDCPSLTNSCPAGN